MNFARLLPRFLLTVLILPYPIPVFKINPTCSNHFSCRDNHNAMTQTLTLLFYNLHSKTKTFGFLSFCFLFIQANYIAAQCPMTCNNGVQASLDENCENEIMWDDLYEGTPPANCIDDFVVEVLDPTGKPLPNSPIVTVTELNQTLIGRLTHTPSGQSCQTSILVEDKLPPHIVCTDTLLSCFHDLDPNEIGFPEYYDNCTRAPEITFIDQNTTFNCTSTDTVQIINRSWSVVDTSGNSANCSQVIIIERPPIDSIDFPANLDNISAPPLYCTSAETDPDHTGVPMFDSLLIDSVWSFYIDYEDVTVPICDGSYTIFRDWTVYDGCRATSTSMEQTINVMDTLPPDLVCPADFSVTVETNSCLATVSMPQPATQDSCSSIINVTLEGSFGLIQGMTIPDLAMGDYLTTCHVTDDCGNVSSCQFNISVVDDIPPVAVSINNPIVALLPQGITYLPSTTFNGGSWDNCDDLKVSARRMDSPACQGDDQTDFGSEVPFYCCDMDSLVEIVLKVEDLSGNSSTVSTFVKVVDNIKPEITCPANISIDCSEDYNNLSLTGEPSIEENCSGFTVNFADSMDFDNCGEGTVERHWEVIDVGGKMADCTQTISVENQTPFFINVTNPNDPNDNVIWPSNYISTTCGDGLLPEELPSGFDFPQILADSFCNLIAINYTDTWLSQPNNACIEIIREWTIVDWCQFNPFNFDGSWEYAQIIRIQNSDKPIINTSCDFVEYCSHDDDCEFGTVELQIDATDDCNGPSELNYLFAIDFFDDGTNNLYGGAAAVTADIPIGVHRVYWEVEDGCYNKVKCDYLFSVVDCKEPTPVCDQMIVEIMDSADPAVSISANMLDAGSYDNCTPDDALQFSFSDDPTDTIKMFDCSQMGINPLELWVTDEEGNQDFCKIGVEVQANNNACSNGSLISGNVALNNGDQVALVKISLNTMNMNDSMVTDIDGTYRFENVPLGEDYSITPFKNENLLNGVTTFDLVVISRHILGVKPLDSPYKFIAADANNSGTVTTLDMVNIRKAILNITTSFPNNNSWRFVDKDFQFTNPINPIGEDFPEVININNLSADIKADFIAIKIGDVNDSANPEE